MPTYEYKCKNCKHEFEEVQSINSEALVICPKCKTPNLFRVIGKGGGMIFKGSGFYQTDYKNTKSDTKETKTVSTSPSVKKPSTDTKPDSTPQPPSKPKDKGSE